MKTLQQQYQLIKEGKGNKEQFLKQARNLFPEFITVNNDYKTTVHILKSKSILSEGIGGVTTINPNSKPDWFKIFDTNLREAVGVKNTKEYGDQNEFEKIDSETQKTLDNANFDYKDEKNIDNVYGQSFLMGYYTEMKDPKNADKTVDELKAIVLKNMAKDVTYYNTKTSFGVKDIGYTKDVVGGGDPVAPKGKYKSSGYGDMPKVVKEGKDEIVNLKKKQNKSLNELKPMDDEYGERDFLGGETDPHNIGRDENKIAKYKKYTYTLDGKEVTPDDIDFYDNLLGAELDGEVYKMGTPDENGNVELKAAKGKTGMYTESLNEGKSKKPTVDSHIKEIEKASAVAALESKLNAVKEAIETRESKLQVAESEDLAEMIDKSMIKKIQQEIKQLEKYKMQCEKQLSKLGGKTAVVDNEEINENVYDSDPTDGDKDFDMEQTVLANELYDKGLQAYSEGDLLKAERLYKGALKAGSWLGWTEVDLPPYEKMTK